MGRLLIRNQYDNRWLDTCRNPLLVRSPDNRRWIRVDPKKLNMRNSINGGWIENDCSKNPRFDPECEFSLIGSINCPTGIPTIELGSGDGNGSGGPLFDLLEGYPPGYDLPDAGQSGFLVERDEGTVKGYALKRPGLNFALESYDESGSTPSLGRGSWDNPNYLGSSVFGGGAQITESIFDLGQFPGYVEITFASYDNVGISVDVYYMGVRVATTCGRVRERSKIEFYYDPAIGEGESRVMIRVRGKESTRWSYQTAGVKQSLPIFALDNTDVAQMAQTLIEEYVGSPLFPAPCHATVFPSEYRTADGKWFYEFHHVIGSTFDQNTIWEMVLDYTSWLNADKFEVYHGGLRIASTMDPDQELGMLRFTWRPWQFATRVPDLMIRVTADERIYGEDILSWYYTLFCPNTIGYRANPWLCNEPGAGISSLGHSSTEDNFDMDNGVDPGVVSIRITEFSGVDYVISAFDSNMELIASIQGRNTSFLQFFVDQALHGDTRKFITVRVDAPLLSSWTYWVGCPIPILDVEMDDKIIPVCNDDIEIVVNDINIPRGTIGNFVVSTNIPVAQDVTVDYVTVDDTAKSVASFGALGTVYALTGPEDDIASLVTAELASSVMLFDASFHRLMNDQYKQGQSSIFNVNNAVNSYSTLSNDGKAVVNILRTKLGTLNGKTWLVLAGGISADVSLQGEWGYRASNFIQSMRDIYGMTIVVVPFQTQTGFANSSWHNALTPGQEWDIVTIADTKEYSLASGQSIASVYTSGGYSDLAANIANRIRNGLNLHYVMRSATTQADIQRNNFLARELLNQFPEVKVNFAFDKSNLKTPPYYVQEHLDEVPNSPYAQSVNSTGVFDSDNRQVWVTYERSTPAVVDPDYTGRSGTVTIPVGQISAQIPVETLTPAHDSIGRQFRLVLSNASEGTIIDDMGIATIIANTGGIVSDFNFTKTSFMASSYNTTQNTGSGSFVLTFGASIGIGIGYSQIADNSRPNIEQPGKVAFCEYNSGLVSNPSVRNVHGVCASYPHDPARTYEYKWEAVETYNDINLGNVRASASAGSVPLGTWSPDAFRLAIGITQGHDYSAEGKRSTWSVYAFIRDDLGNVYKSNELTVTLLSTPVSRFNIQ